MDPDGCPEKHRPGIFAAYLSEFYVVEARFSGRTEVLYVRSIEDQH